MLVNLFQNLLVAMRVYLSCPVQDDYNVGEAGWPMLNEYSVVVYGCFVIDTPQSRVAVQELWCYMTAGSEDPINATEMG